MQRSRWLSRLSRGSRVSRYEAGRITPSAEALVRLAETSNASIDHLLRDDIPQPPLRAPKTALGDRPAAIAELDDDALAVLNGVIDGLPRARAQQR